MWKGLGLTLMVLVGILWGALPADAALSKANHPANVTVVKTSTSLERPGPGEHCDGSEDSEVITAAYHQNPVYGPVVLTRIKRFKALNYPVVSASSRGSRNNIRIQPFYQLILFPFHGFW